MWEQSFCLLSQTNQPQALKNMLTAKKICCHKIPSILKALLLVVLESNMLL